MPCGLFASGQYGAWSCRSALQATSWLNDKVVLNEKPVKYVWGFCQGQVINNGIVVDERTYTFEFKLLIQLFNDEKKTLIEKILKSSSCTAGVALF